MNSVAELRRDVAIVMGFMGRRPLGQQLKRREEQQGEEPQDTRLTNQKSCGKPLFRGMRYVDFLGHCLAQKTKFGRETKFRSSSQRKVNIKSAVYRSFRLKGTLIVIAHIPRGKQVFKGMFTATETWRNMSFIIIIVSITP